MGRAATTWGGQPTGRLRTALNELPHFVRCEWPGRAQCLVRCQLVREQPNSRRPSAAKRFRAVLAEEFARRRQVNPRYSLRAFAGSLGMEHATVSQLLRGSRPITNKSMTTIGARLRWTGSQVLARAGEECKFDSRRIARNLNLSVDAVNVALTDLCMFGLIELKGEQTKCQTP